MVTRSKSSFVLPSSSTSRATSTARSPTRIGLFSPLGVSITGAVFHNLGQLGVACLVLNSFAPLVYLPYLILLGAVTGTFIGMIGKIIEKANKR